MPVRSPTCHQLLVTLRFSRPILTPLLCVLFPALPRVSVHPCAGLSAYLSLFFFAARRSLFLILIIERSWQSILSLKPSSHWRLHYACVCAMATKKNLRLNNSNFLLIYAKPFFALASQQLLWYLHVVFWRFGRSLTMSLSISQYILRTFACGIL